MQRLHDQTDRVDITRYGPLHLLLMGGDQIYSDDMWTAVPALRDWCDLPWSQRIAAPFTPALRSALETHFSRLYLDHFGAPETAALLAQVPSVMMWDDHDILDGWGSHPHELHDSPVFQGIFAVAKAAFELFQRQMMGARAPGHPARPGPPQQRLPHGLHGSAGAGHAQRAPTPQRRHRGDRRPAASRTGAQRKKLALGLPMAGHPGGRPGA